MSAACPSRRVVLLGASNLIRSLPSAVAVAEGALGKPLDILCGAGHGRSYGAVSSFLFVRCLPSLRDCGLWEALRKRPPLPTYAWLGDIGNDLLHDYTPDQILGWVADCLDRLREYTEEVVLCQLPLASLRKVGPKRYRLIRTLTYPRSTLPYQTAMDSIAELNDGIATLAAQRGMTTFVPQSDWYGFDPIHIQSRRHLRAWQAMMTGWSTAHHEQLLSLSSATVERRQMRHLRPHSRTLFGLTQLQNQPARTYKDGTQLSLF